MRMRRAKPSLAVGWYDNHLWQPSDTQWLIFHSSPMSLLPHNWIYETSRRFAASRFANGLAESETKARQRKQSRIMAQSMARIQRTRNCSQVLRTSLRQLTLFSTQRGLVIIK